MQSQLVFLLMIACLSSLRCRSTWLRMFRNIFSSSIIYNYITKCTKICGLVTSYDISIKKIPNLVTCWEFIPLQPCWSSWTSRSSENNRFPYVFHRLVVSCKFRSICFAKFVRQIWTSSLHDTFTSSICIINTLVPHVLRAIPFHVYQTIETHITSVCKINMKISFQTIKWNLHSFCVIFLLTSITCCIDIILFCTNVVLIVVNKQIN
jgi:hypothetical protein